MESNVTEYSRIDGGRGGDATICVYNGEMQRGKPTMYMYSG
jgi:hypothetical protein